VAKDSKNFHYEAHSVRHGDHHPQPTSHKPEAKNKERIDLSIREIRQLFESFKGIRISNRLAYQIQEALGSGEGEQVGPVLNIDGIKVRFAINGLPGLAAFRRALLYRCLIKSRFKDNTIDLENTAHFLKLKSKGVLKPVEILKRRLLLEGITISNEGRDVRVRGGMSFEEMSFDFDCPKDGIDSAEFGRKLLVAVYEYHDCSVGATAEFFHTNEQLMWGILKRSGVEFNTPESLKQFQLPTELEAQFGPAIQKQLKEGLRSPMAEIMRTAESRAAKKKLANRKFLDEMEERIKNYIQLVMVPEFGTTVLNEENAGALHASAWHFLQWDIGQLPVEDILNLEIVSPFEMMLTRTLKYLDLTEKGCPAFFNKDYVRNIPKPYAHIILTPETLKLIFRYFKTADLLESSFHASVIQDTHGEEHPHNALLEIELKHLQRIPIEIRDEEIKLKLNKTLKNVGNHHELHGILSVEVKQVLAVLQDILDHHDIELYGIQDEDIESIHKAIRQAIEEIQPFIKDAVQIYQGFDSILEAYLKALNAFEKLCNFHTQKALEGRKAITTWASLSDLYRRVYSVKGLDPPGSRRKKATRQRQEGYPMLRFGPHIEQILPEILVRATFAYPTASFTKLNLIPPHLRAYLIIDEPNNHMGHYHLAAWAFRIHWKRRRLGHGQKSVADDYIRSLRFLRAFIFRKDHKSEPHIILCNVDSEVFGQAEYAGGGKIIDLSKKIITENLKILPKNILEITQAEEPANEHDKVVMILEKIMRK